MQKHQTRWKPLSQDYRGRVWVSGDYKIKRNFQRGVGGPEYFVFQVRSYYCHFYGNYRYMWDWAMIGSATAWDDARKLAELAEMYDGG